MSLFRVSHNDIRSLVDHQPPPTDPGDRKAYLSLLFQRAMDTFDPADWHPLLAGFLPPEIAEIHLPQWRAKR